MKSENENLLMNLTFCSTNFESLRYICSVFQFNSQFVSSNKSYEIDWDVKNLKNEIKVAQLAGYVAEHSAYHHGEQSLCSTIVNMAQTYVGSNNINYLEPIGQFGTRNLGGKDAASARYIYTNLNPITRKIFREDDDHIL